MEQAEQRMAEAAEPGCLRIVVVLKTNAGGLWIMPQVEEFRNRGHYVVVVLPPGPGRLAAVLAERGFDVVESPFDFVFRPRPATMTALWRFRRLLLALRPDVVHYHLYASAIASRLAGAGLPALKAHMVAGPLFLESPVIRWAERALWRLDDLTVCGTEFTSRLYGELGCPESRRPVVTYGVDTSRFSTAMLAGEGVPEPASRMTPAALKSKVRAEMRIGEDVFLAVMVAFVYPPKGLVHRGRGIKGHDVLLDAWSRFHAKRPSSHLLIVGGGWTQAGEEYRARLIRRFDVTNRSDVTWMDSVPEVRTVYAAADLSISPSLSEGHGAAVEASSMGVPSVVSDAGGLPETVDETSGWVVPRDDPTALAGVLEAAYREFTVDGLAIRGQRARHRTVQLFDNAVAARRLAVIIEHATRPLGSPIEEAAAS